MFNTIDFSKRSTGKELLDENDLDIPQLKQNLNEFIYLNKILRAKATLLQALKKITSHYRQAFSNKTLNIADFGCGAGDLLIAIHHWAAKNHFSTHLTGIDCNTAIVNFAKEKTKNYANVIIYQEDILLATIYKNSFDIVCLNNVCHHFSDDQILSLIHQLSMQTHYAIIINDLRRHWLAYYAIKGLSKFFNLSKFAQHDGPVSVLKSFTQGELQHYLSKIPCRRYEINPIFPFRWQVIIWVN